MNNYIIHYKWLYYILNYLLLNTIYFTQLFIKNYINLYNIYYSHFLQSLMIIRLSSYKILKSLKD